MNRLTLRQDRDIGHDEIKEELEGVDDWREITRRTSGDTVRIETGIDDENRLDNIENAVSSIDGLDVMEGWESFDTDHS